MSASGDVGTIRRENLPGTRGDQPLPAQWDGHAGAARIARELRYLSTRGRVAEHRMLWIALVLCLVFHGSLELSGSYQRTYDAYVHIFFADHYARWWFSSWDPRWYTGFSVVSYPPGSHFSIAALSHVFGLRTGFVIVQIFALLNCTVGIYRVSQVWANQRAAGWAALAFVVSSSIAETVHVFGQLPTTFSLGFLLNSLPFAYRWVTTGSRKAYLLGIACTAACTAGHHVTTLFGSVFFVGPMLLHGVVQSLRSPLPGEPTGSLASLGRATLWPALARRLRRVLRPVLRAGVYGGTLGVVLFTVVMPYWLFSHSDPIVQVSIPHASRDNFLVNTAAGLVFWLIPWGTTLIVLPYAVVRGLASKAWPMTLSLLLLAFLGTGGTTPYPAMLLGGAFWVLTLDRFTFWATITILPLVGLFCESITAGSLRQFLLRRVGRRMSAVIPIVLLIGHLAFTLFSANLTHYRPFQPAAIDPKPIVNFLEKDDHDKWRYITLGFGDQMAWLGANTTAQTVDGNYHSARRLPELTSRPVERLEGAKYSGVPGIGSLQQFLAVPERYSLKYALVYDHFYDPLLNAMGWVNLGALENGIEVWERADVPPLADVVNRQVPIWQRAMWGTLPPFALVAALMMMLWWATGERLPRPVCGGIRRFFRFTAKLPPARLMGRIDRRLAQAAARLPQAGPEQVQAHQWRGLQPLVGRFRRRSTRMISVRKRRATALLVALLMVGGVGAGAYSLTPRPPGTPDDVLFLYFDHLDFRRFPQAYALLDPETRPDFTQFRMELGRDGGLVASFGKLDEIHLKVIRRTPEAALVRVRLVYLTAVNKYSTEQEVEMVRRPGEPWSIVFPPGDPTEPPDQFTSRTGVRFVSAGRRRVTSGATRSTDVLDRPQLFLTDVKTLRVGPRWLVIGRVINIDVDPADVTVTAELRDADGRLLAYWNASDQINHHLLPGESSVFRIEFQSIAGTAPPGSEARNGSLHVVEGKDQGPAVVKLDPSPVGPVVPLNGPVEFDPTSIVPLALPPGKQVGSVTVTTRGVVTSRNLGRGLQVMDLHLRRDRAGQDWISGRLRNDGADEVAIPRLLLGYWDTRGKLAWVDQAYLPHSLSPQREVTFDVPLSNAVGLRDAGVDTTWFSGPAHDIPKHRLGPLLSLPASTGFGALTLQTFGYVRGPAS